MPTVIKAPFLRLIVNSYMHYLFIILGKRADKYLKEKALQQAPCQAKRIMTIHKQNFYKYLKPVADELGLILLCQVTLSEII